MVYDYLRRWNDYSRFIKIQFTEFWENIENFINKRYTNIQKISERLDEFGNKLGTNDISASKLQYPFIWAVKLICEQPYVVDMETYNENRLNYHYFPTDQTKPVPVRLKTWHAYHKLLPSTFFYLQSFNFEIVKSNGEKPLRNNNPIFDLNARILDSIGYNSLIRSLDGHSDYTYALRVLYQIRNNITHGHKISPNVRDIYLMNQGNIALFELIECIKQIQNL